MASTRIVEEERGTYRGNPIPLHNGYWAGDFSDRPVTTGVTSPRPTTWR